MASDLYGIFVIERKEIWLPRYGIDDRIKTNICLTAIANSAPYHVIEWMSCKPTEMPFTAVYNILLIQNMHKFCYIINNM